MKIETIQLWEDREDVTLTAYCLEQNQEIQGSECRPAVIVSPGGGYEGFTEREGEAVALRFSAAGYQAFVLHYSLREKAQFPNAVYDLGKAFCYLHEQKKRLCVDAEKIVVCGFSAGANLSAALGVLWDKPFFYEKFNVPSDWLRPAAMVLGYSLISPRIQNYGRLNPEELAMIRQCNAYLLGTDEPDEEDYKRVDLTNYISEQTPPAFLFHLNADPVVPIDNTLSFAGELAKQHVPFELYIGEDEWHGVSLFETKDTDLGFFKEEYAAWFAMALSWLKRKIFGRTEGL